MRLVEKGIFPEAAIDEDRLFGMVPRPCVALHGFAQASWGIRMGRQNGLAADHNKDRLSRGGRRGAKQVL